ncbi:hypothetical protein QVD17_37439 [Tagetes erecta]|uniref:Uncharacterized protein n=1 Tax=Tagetes erecta TaxID=13708 RepID=A0AAD8NJ66_TARER|nr:hypothetical protein QVD17_37439 [Tagetes erecta]
MDQIIKELTEVLDLQWKYENSKHEMAADEGTSSNNLEISLSKIRSATNGFDKAYWVGSSGDKVLSGRVAYDSVYTNDNDMVLAPIARRRFNEQTLKELIDPKITEEDDNIFTLNRGPNEDSFEKFSEIAYKCLAETQTKRPTIEVVIEELQKALNLQGKTVVLSRKTVHKTM